MIGQQKLLLLWAWMLLVALLCPGIQSKRGGGKGGGGGGKTTASQSRGSSKQGLKLAGAAAAGALGGAAIGYGLGSLGKTSHGRGHGHGHGYSYDSSVHDRRPYKPEGSGLRNQSDWRLYRRVAAAGPTHMSNIFLLTLGSMVPFFFVDWIRGI